MIYSGTVAAAMEGTLEGAAGSGGEQRFRFDWRQFDGAARQAMDVAESAIAGGWPEGLLLNLNVPAVPPDRIGLAALVPTWVRRYVDQFDERFDPRGRSYYRVAGEVVNDFEADGSGPKDWPTDVAQVQGGGVALTLPHRTVLARALPPLPIAGLAARQTL